MQNIRRIQLIHYYYKRFICVLFCLLSFLTHVPSSHALICTTLFSSSIAHNDSLTRWIKKSLARIKTRITNLKKSRDDMNNAKKKIETLITLILTMATESNTLLTQSTEKTDEHIRLHEFKNALSALVGMFEELRETYNQNTIDENQLAIIEKAYFFVTLLQGITLDNQTADLSFSQKRQPIEQSIAEIIALATYAIPKNYHIKIISSIPQDIHHVIINPLEILEVMLNLIINAQHAMPTGGRILITAENKEIIFHHHLQSGTYVVISVHDNGGGIEPKNIEHVFDPSFTTKKEGKGSGIGLAKSKDIIEKHKGYIEVSSRRGIETTFTIYLPAKPEKDLQKKVGKTILLVEDDHGVALSIILVLKSIGFEVVHKESGEEAIIEYTKALQKNRPFHGLITDYMSTGTMTGIDVAHEIHAENPQFPIILITGMISAHIQSQDDPSLAAIIAKPYDIPLLSEKITKIFGEPTIH